MSHNDFESLPGDTLPSKPVWSDATGEIGEQEPSKNLTCPIDLNALPDHEVIRRLDKGGMGIVFLVRQKHMGRFEAMKVVQPHLTDRPELVERFLREIRAAGSLDHPNIITIYAAMKTTHGVVFTMKYIEGEDLRKVVENGGPLPVPLACDYALQAASGLQHAYERGFVHRDIKPANLILDKNGLVKILDFGLAKAIREHESPTHLTQSEQVLGTLDFLAPEQSRDARKSDIRADVYSLGCTLHYLLSGAPPFRASTRSELIEAHRSRLARPLDQVRADVPAELASIVAKMMAKDPARRYQSPAEVVEALAPFAGSGNTGVGPKPRRSPIRRLRSVFSQPRSRLLAALAGCVVLVMILAAFGLGRKDAAKKAGPMNPGTTVAYRSECDVYVAERGGDILADRPVLGGTFDFLRRDDLVYIVAKLLDQKTAYFYVLQIDSRGQATALFPKDWAPGRLPTTESERADLRIPQLGEMPMDQEAPPGLEAMICFVRPEPLTPEHNDLLWDLCTGKEFAWVQPKAFEKVFVSFVDGKRTEDRGFDPTGARVGKDPVSQAERVLLALRDRGVAAHSRGMCYPLVAPRAARAKSGKDR